MALTNKQRIGAAASMAAVIAAPAEGLRRVAYYDPPGVLTVCRGHTGPDVEAKKIYSLSECDELFDEDMRKAVQLVDKCVPGLPVKVLAAFSDAGYNMGKTIACDPGNSQAARFLIAGNYDAACNQLPKWDKARVAGVLVSLPGLTSRRKLEQTLCLTWRQE